MSDCACCRQAFPIVLIGKLKSLPRTDVGSQVPRYIRLIGTLHGTASNICHALIRQHHQPGEIVFKMPKLATILEQISEGLGMGSHKWRRCDNWKLHQVLSACTSCQQGYHL